MRGGDTPVPDTRTVYAENANGWDCVTAYYWVEGDTPLTWPGVQMEQDNRTAGILLKSRKSIQR